MIRKFLKKVLKVLLIVFAVCAVLVLITIANFLSHLDKYEPKLDSEYYASYYVYTSSKTRKIAEQGENINILVLPNNTGRTSNNIKKHETVALVQSYLSHFIFNKLNTIIIVPAFMRTQEDNLIYTQAMDRDTMVTEIKELSRVDLQLNAMIEDVQCDYKNKGWNVNEKVLMCGHSASGMFVNRYAVLHPEKVRAVAVFAPGGWAIAPIRNYKGEQLRYPIGISDLLEITQIHFNKEEYIQVPHLFVIGSEDTNDSVPYSDSYDHEDREIIDRLFGKTPIQRWIISEELYKEQMVNVEFLTYDGMGHIPSFRSLKDLLKFMEENLD